MRPRDDADENDKERDQDRGPENSRHDDVKRFDRYGVMLPRRPAPNPEEAPEHGGYNPKEACRPGGIRGVRRRRGRHHGMAEVLKKS